MAEGGSTSKPTPERLAALIDHSILHPTVSDDDCRAQCAIAAEYKTATVCVKPCHVALATECLRGSSVGVCTVIGFPHGTCTTATKAFEATDAIKNGAVELDMVMNTGKALQGDMEYVENDIRAVVEAAGEIPVKVIIETDFLGKRSAELIPELCARLTAAGARYIKTSTGFGFVKTPEGSYKYLGATAPDLRIMKEHAPPALLVKASGGVRDAKALLKCFGIGVARVGATATKPMIDEAKRLVEEGTDLAALLEEVMADDSVLAGGLGY